MNIVIPGAVSRLPRRSNAAALMCLLGTTFLSLTAMAQTPIVPLDTLVASNGSVTAGNITFTNFQKPTALPQPLGAALFEFNDIGVSATANSDGTVTLNFLFIDPTTGLATPVVSAGDVTRLVTYTTSVNNPALRLHSVSQVYGPLTTGSGPVTLYDILFHVDPAIVALIGAGPTYRTLQGSAFASPAPLPGGNPPNITMTNEFGILKGHLGIPTSGTMDFIGVNFTLVPVGSPVPPVVVNLAQPTSFLIDPLSGLLQFGLNTYAQDGGAVIALTSDNPGLLAVPPSVTIPQGNFISVPLAPQAANVDFPVVVNLTATFNGITQTQPYTVNPPVPLALVGFSAGTPTCLAGIVSVPCAVNTTMKVGFFLNRTNVSAETVTLTSSNPEICPIPASMTVPALTSQTVPSVVMMTCKPVATNTPITYTGSLNGVVYTATATFPRTIDSVTITKAELVVKSLSLKVEAGNQIPNDVLTLYNNATGQLIGNMTYVGLSGGGGKYSYQGTVSAPVATLLLRSALNGSTTLAVVQK